MSVQVLVRNKSAQKKLYRSDALARLAETVFDNDYIEEDAEVSVLFCDDDYIRELNLQYRNNHKPTDVLSFPQESPVIGDVWLLGDIVISLETVARRWPDDPAAMRQEVRLLFCHGLLHLLGYDHQNAGDRDIMIAKQANALGVPASDAWLYGAPH